MNLDTFKVDSVIVHDVPRGSDTDEHLTLTDLPINLDEDLRRYFKRKIATSLAERGVEVVADENEDPTLRSAVAEILRDPNSLVPASRHIAQRLDDVQTRRNPAGLIAVIRGSVDKKPAVSIMKLEREQGLRFRIDVVKGQRVVDMQYLRDLTLTDKTKVFKTSLLVSRSRKATAGTIQGRVSDNQGGQDIGGGVASFFLGTFLGCRLKDNPEKSTLVFVQAADGFINGSVQSAERRGRYQVALLAALQGQDRELRPRTFAASSLEPADRSAFLDQVRSAGLDPDVPFPKDTALVKVSGFRMTFESGMVLVGSQTDLRDRVEIRSEDAGPPSVEIKDAIKRLSGR